jgi:hypothetical protein
VGPQRVGAAAAGAAVVGLEVMAAIVQGFAGRAARLQQLTMHVDQLAGAGTLVQIVDVLGHHQHLARPALLEQSQRLVGRVRLDRGVEQLAAALVIEALHDGVLAGEGFRRGDLLQLSPLPQAIGAAKAGQAGFDRDPRTGQDDDRALRVYGTRQRCSGRDQVGLDRLDVERGRH